MDRMKVESVMEMSMEKVIAYVNTNRGDGQKESLERFYNLLDKLGNPHKGLKYIHITGTNGKGSTAAMLQSIFREAELNVGLFTSPHLEVVNERIRLNGEYIADADFIRLVDKIEPIVLDLEEKMGVKFYAFELLTAVAFLYFQEKQPDIIILEAGIGGRIDSTNVIEESEVSIITSIGLDHMATLGNTLQEIMSEKAHIIKEGGPLIVGPVDNTLKQVTEKIADEIHGTVTFLDKTNIHIEKTTLKNQLFSYKNWQTIKLTMLGLHQIENASLILEACEQLIAKGWPISREMVYQGLEKAAWPGRFEKIFEKPLFYIDGAHNEASVKRMVETLETSFPDKKFHFVMGMMKDKDYTKMIQLVVHLAKDFYLVSPDWQRGFDVYEVAKDLSKAGYQAKAMKNIEEVLEFIQNELPKDETVIQFGSLYLVGDMKRAIKAKNTP